MNMNINMNPNSELHQSIVNVPDLVQVPEVWVNQARQFQQAMMRYTCAIREVKTKLEVLNDELSVKNQRNPIEMIKSRVKKPVSIVEKLQRRGFEVSLDSMEKTWMMLRESASSAPLWMISMKWPTCLCARMM